MSNHVPTRTRRSSVLSPLVLGALGALAAGCLADAEPAPEAQDETGAGEQPIVSVGSPVVGPSTTSATLPAAGMSAVPASTPITDTSSSAIRLASFSNGADLAAGPTSDRASWRNAATTDPFSAPPALRTHLDEALASADAKVVAALDEADARAVLADFAARFPGGLSASVTQDFDGFAAARARWLKRSSEKAGTFNYPDPRLFSEARQRGARLYCAAREVQRQQSARRKRSMGRRALAELNLFGRTVDLLVMEPTVVLDGPERFTGSGVNDGAQAFVVPILAGGKLTPIGNIGLPGFGEMRAPLAFVSADGEVVNDASRDLTTGFFNRRFQTVTHADAVVSRRAVVQPDPVRFPLFDIGVVHVNFELKARADIGTLGTPNERLLGHTTGTLPFGLTPRPTGPLGSIVTPFPVSWGDMPMMLNSGTPATPTPVAPAAGLRWFLLSPSGAGDMGLMPVTNPMLARMIQDDDHTFTVRHSAGMEAVLTAGAGLDIGIFAMWLDVSGGLGVNGGQEQVLRDAVVLENQQPVAMLSVTPRGFVNATYSAGIKLHLRFGPFGFDVPIVNTRGTLAETTTGDWPEANRFRMGTGSGTGAPLTQPNVLSHLPLDPGGAFSSFPAGNDVNTCLADTAPNPPTPPPCAADAPSGTRPAVSICLTGRAVSGFPYPSNVCADPASYSSTLRASGFSAAQAKCVESQLSLVCAPVSAQTSLTSVNHVTNIRFNPDGSVDTSAIGAEAEAVRAAMQQCEDAFGAGAARSLFGVEACDDHGKPFSPNQPLFSVTGGNTTIRPPSCE
ncbi:hypothetical protein WME90_47600 [Sorangium sp. So ce375]|uniref:hypothetical protein n=1 Tax=Sorangium sp. So ce375 TaxID=3133306 RepID=UPI003F5B515D